MFDDLKEVNSQTVSNSQSVQADTHTQVPMQAVKPAVVSDMFDDSTPATPLDGSKPSAIQSGKIKPVSQTSSVSIPTETSQVQVAPTPQKIATPNIPPMDSMMITDSRLSGPMRKIIIIVLVIFMLSIAGGGIYYFFFNAKNIDSIVNENTNINTEVVNQNINEKKEVVEEIVNDDDLDDDFDGLSNELEKIYGTNPLEADSDNDGLFDQDEVEVYKTDPLSDDSDNDNLSDYEEIIVYKTDPNDPDTDGDNFSDGIEVSNGYNPLGNGKIGDLDIDNLGNNEGLNIN